MYKNRKLCYFLQFKGTVLRDFRPLIFYYLRENEKVNETFLALFILAPGRVFFF